MLKGKILRMKKKAPFEQWFNVNARFKEGKIDSISIQSQGAFAVDISLCIKSGISIEFSCDFIFFNN